jgi:hypothetical protein
MLHKSQRPPLTIDEKVKQAIAGLASKRWNSIYVAAKGIRISAKTLTRRVNGERHASRPEKSSKH